VAVYNNSRLAEVKQRVLAVL